MRNIIKLLAVILFVSTITFDATAQTSIPTPLTAPKGSTHRPKDETTPIGTGTMLMLGLGCGVLCYKVRKKDNR
ncbi:MAG: hypothetical protein IJ681_10135 [Bacteroidales bacterium]|nr:hypothetical protein [Bacteroidales bacterium]